MNFIKFDSVKKRMLVSLNSVKHFRARGLVLLIESFSHSKESNCISRFGVARQNWCVLSIHDKIQKFSIFSEVYENKIFGTLEPKVEPPEFTIPCGRALKSENPCFSSL